MELQSIIIALFTTLLGGGLGSLITIKARNRKANSEADQAEKNTEALTLKNTNEIVDLYKTAMSDMRELNQKREEELQKKIEDQNTKIKEQNEKLDQYSKTLHKQNELIEKLTQTQGILKLEIERLKRLALDNCDNCEFKENCLKYVAKTALNSTIRVPGEDSSSEKVK